MASSMTRITVTLKSSERDALHILAQQEYRDIRAQAALIIRQELERRGLLPIVDANPDSKLVQEIDRRLLS
jgi:hypothetical protein